MFCFLNTIFVSLRDKLFLINIYRSHKGIIVLLFTRLQIWSQITSLESSLSHLFVVWIALWKSFNFSNLQFPHWWTKSYGSHFTGEWNDKCMWKTKHDQMLDNFFSFSIFERMYDSHFPWTQRGEEGLRYVCWLLTGS